jgi:ribosomal protein S18 acetylase RimI-like enzyme
VRVLTQDDWPIWRELRLAALAEAPDAFGSRLADWQGEGDREERWRGRLAIPGSYNIVALIDGSPAGMASGIPGDEPGVAELISMWVSPAARGRGVGDRLLAAVEQWARQAGAAVLKLLVYEGNASAQALYRRAGFTGTGEVRPDGDRREVVMRKAL